MTDRETDCVPFSCFFLRLEKESAILYIMSREKKAVKKPKTKKKTDYYDYSLLAVIILLTCFGLVMLYSTSSYMAELNYIHPFREGNGRSTRIWLDCILKKELHQVVDWSRVDKSDYLMAMERSPVKDLEIKVLLHKALTEQIHDRQVYMKGIDASYHYEGYQIFRTEELAKK